MRVFDCFLIYRGTYYSIYFHADNSAYSEVYDYYKKCNMPTRASLLYLVKIMADHGRIYDTGKFRIENKQHKIYAFKAKEQRFFCFFMKNKKIVITSAYRKFKQLVDRKALRKTIKIREKYL